MSAATANEGPILVWGAGAIGGSLGASFIQQGETVVFVDAAAEHVAAIEREGLRIEGPIFEATVGARACSPDELEGTFSRAFLCVKALHTEAAIRQLSSHLAADGFVVSAQNGLNEHAIAEVVGAARTVGCFVNFGADYLEPGVVHLSGRGAVVVGEIDGRRTERIEAIHRLMAGFDPAAVLTDNIWGFLWGKLVYGALLFGTALTDDSIADVLDDRQFRPVLTALGQEVARVAAAEGVRMEAFDGFRPDAFSAEAAPDETAQSFDDMVAHNRRSLKTHSGIWRDLAVRKRKTEAEHQLGPIAATGRRHGVATPLTERLVAMIGEIESGRRPLSRANLAELGGATERSAA
ncbi:ketopantoate reductase family protein [Aureimonas leprariae]|uniref:2-dehydropantoate 2-reductase n=1 Tax=Plantimonas leprariae TaxID=2615207 RepID=A0A7V7PL00_9HYPH|nr:2-dehydropantoate 2-reductase [Aureimonas leprariae]KAB0676812.1 2-dehydropantoate 2-reductase [Aureimonas leprariae]